MHCYSIRARPDKIWNAIAGIALALLAGAAPLAAQQECQPVFDAMDKVLRTPTRMFTTTTVDGKPQTTETLYTAGGLYTNASGRWVRSDITLQQAKKLDEDGRKNSAHVCRYLRDEPVNNEKAAVYRTQLGTPGKSSDGTMWISRGSGLPLKNEVDVDSGGSGPRNHFSVRYDYKNVAPPKQ